MFDFSEPFENTAGSTWVPYLIRLQILHKCMYNPMSLEIPVICSITLHIPISTIPIALHAGSSHNHAILLYHVALLCMFLQNFFMLPNHFLSVDAAHSL
jgi:hypothetical protein